MVENLENEHWKTIEGYEDYEVSNFGRIKSLGNDKMRKEKILKQATDKKGYQLISLWKNGKKKSFKVNRLVAMAFISNSNNYEQVNHKDEVKANNHVSNLEWCDCKYNVNYGTARERISKAMSSDNNPKYWFGKLGKEHHSSKQVIQLTLGGDYIKLWDSIADVERKLGYYNSSISECCRGKRKSAYKYKWQFA